MKLNIQSFGWYRKPMTILVVLICCTNKMFAQEPKQSFNKTNSSAVISPALLKQDLLFFKQALQRNHPGLYRYKSETQVNHLFDSCYAAVNQAIPALEFAKSIAFLIGFIEDGHTASNAPRLLMNEYIENEPLFPVHVYYVGSKAFVFCSNIKELIPSTELLAIDNVPVTQIKKTLLQYLPGDGNIETKKLHTLNNGAFSFLYRWVFGRKASFAIRYKTNKGVVKTTKISAAFAKELECDYATGPYNKKDLQLDFPEPHTALLTIKTFDDNRLGSKQNFTSFLDAAFREINTRGISSLIIDLRGNAGGRDEYGSLLYSYLATRPFKYFLSVASVDSKVSLQDNSLLGLQQPNANNYKGKVLLLINGLCFSTTADFCAIVKSNNRAVFIGEETGGAYYGNTSGEIKNVSLPNSNIIIKIPLYKYVNDVRDLKYGDRGIIPDHIIIPTINDLLLKKDAQLSFAISLTK